MRLLRFWIALVVVSAFFLITSWNSFLVMSSGEKAIAVCTSIEKPAKRRARRGILTRLRGGTHHFRFDLANGEKQAATIQFGLWLRPKVGESVAIVFANGSPQTIYYDSFLYVWLFPLLSGSLLIAMVLKKSVLRKRVETTRANAWWGSGKRKIWKNIRKYLRANQPNLPAPSVMGRFVYRPLHTAERRSLFGSVRSEFFFDGVNVFWLIRSLAMFMKLKPCPRCHIN